MISKRKNISGLLEETKCENTKAANKPIEVSIKLQPNGGDKLADRRKYMRFVGKLIYLTVTKPDISLAVSLVSQFIQKPRTTQWKAVTRILRYLKNTSDVGSFSRKVRHPLEI